jgi:hypothetical protein
LVKRCVYEVGCIRDGLPIIRRQYLSSKELETADPILVGGFISAIQEFTTSTFQDLPEEFRMAKYLACLYRVEGFDNSIILYAICESKTDASVIRTALKKIGTKLMTWHDKLFSSNVDIRIFEPCNCFFDNEFNKINEDAGDRVKRKLASF